MGGHEHGCMGDGLIGDINSYAWVQHSRMNVGYPHVRVTLDVKLKLKRVYFIKVQSCKIIPQERRTSSSHYWTITLSTSLPLCHIEIYGPIIGTSNTALQYWPLDHGISHIPSVYGSTIKSIHIDHRYLCVCLLCIMNLWNCLEGKLLPKVITQSIIL
jgi:hypothetical protein